MHVMLMELENIILFHSHEIVFWKYQADSRSQDHNASKNKDSVENYRELWKMPFMLYFGKGSGCSLPMS